MTLATAAQTFLESTRRRVLVPLALTWLLGSAVVLALSYVSTSQAFDRSLLDDANTVAAQIGLSAEGLAHFSEQHALEVLRHGRSDRVFLAIHDPIRGVVVGEPGLLPQALPPTKQWGFSDQTVRGMRVRQVTLAREATRPFIVVIGQTLGERSEWLKRLVAYSIVPQLSLLLMLGWWLSHSLADEVAPLVRLQRALEQRDTADLRPVEVSAPSYELAALAQSINGLMSRIDRSVHAQREFAGNVAHELRTPLAGVRALAEHGLASGDAAVWQGQLQHIVGRCDRAARLIDQLLALALADEAREVLRLDAVRLDEVVRSTLLSILPQADALRVDIGAVGIDDPVSVHGHLHLLEGVLRNLLDNALRYGKPIHDGEVQTVTVEVRNQGQGVLLSVSDNGPGLDAAARQRLLRRWTQGAGSAKGNGGTGLGLAIAVRYCGLMGAELMLGQSPHGGLTAALRLRHHGSPTAS